MPKIIIPCYNKLSHLALLHAVKFCKITPGIFMTGVIIFVRDFIYFFVMVRKIGPLLRKCSGYATAYYIRKGIIHIPLGSGFLGLS